MARLRRSPILVAALGALAAASLAGAARAEASDGSTTQTGAPQVDAGAHRISGEIRYTAAGAPVTLFHYFALGADCGPAEVAVTLAEPPEHGTVSFVAGAEQPAAAGRPLYPPPDPRARCADRLVATRDAVYAPTAGFAGRDRLTVEFREGGQVFDDAIEVEVEQIAPEKPAPPPRKGRARS